MGKIWGKLKGLYISEKICDMTISFILKRSKAGFTMDDAEGGATIYVRLRDGRSLDSTSSTGYAVNPLWWDAKREEIKANVVCDNEEKAELNEKLQNLKKYLYSKYKTDKEKGKVNKEWLAKALKGFAKQQGKLVDQTNDRSNSFQERFRSFLMPTISVRAESINIVSLKGLCCVSRSLCV